MKQIRLPSYGPLYTGPERATLTILNAALQVAEQALRHEHVQLDDRALGGPQHHAPLVIATAKLIVGRCAELRGLLDAYDQAIDDTLEDDDPIPF